MIKNEKFNRMVIFILWIFLILWRIPFFSRGIDYTDTGYNLVHFQQAFCGNGINDIGTFMTDFLGGLVYWMLPAYQLLAYRIIYGALYFLIDCITYKFFRRYFEPIPILLILVGLSLGSKSGEMLFNYYILTRVFLIAAICMVMYGLRNKRKAAIWGAGILCGINVFVRLPNVLFGSMIFAIFGYEMWSGKSIRNALQTALRYFLGCVAGFFAVTVLVVGTMGIDAVLANVMSYVNLALGKVAEVENVIGIEEVSGHSVAAIIKTLARQGVFGLRDLALYLLPVMIAGIILKGLLKKKRWNDDVIKIICIVLQVLLLVVLYTRVKGSFKNICAIMLLLSCSGFALFGKHLAVERRTLYLMMALLGISCVFGSDLGFQRVGMLQGFMPLTVLMITEDFSELNPSGSDLPKWSCVCRVFMKEYISVLMVGLIVIGTMGLSDTYMDSNYEKLNVAVDDNISVLRGMKTSEIRADQLNEYYFISEADELKNQEVAIFGYFPLGFVIGEQNNYFESVQCCIDYPSVSVEDLLGVINQKTSQGVYPVVILSHINKIQRGDDHDTSEAKVAVMNYMLSIHEYSVYRSDDYFTVYIPQ